nr:ThiS [Erythrotrichia welwitschii]
MNKVVYNDKLKITVSVNGEAFSCTSPVFLEQLLEYLDFNMQTIIVEYNSAIINKKKLASTKLQNRDKIEIVTIVGGG